ncbi:MAG: hypothetical protein COT17_01425 [Elusimicrobia bacterium CG08_land_8_20_14_0_20_51_18]|nr:MAG: hypothetical protein COT17_01425 [Elusimicrobia bacterium CG08_land_8_20_14_0_20_51_18]
MFDKMKDMLELKKKAEQLKKELDGLKFASEDSLVKTEVNASLEVLAVEIKGDLDSLDKNKVQESIKENINKAFRNAQLEAAKRAMGMGF